MYSLQPNFKIEAKVAAAAEKPPTETTVFISYLEYNFNVKYIRRKV